MRLHQYQVLSASRLLSICMCKLDKLQLFYFFPRLNLYLTSISFARLREGLKEMMYASRPADDVMGTHQSAPEIQEDENLITRLLLRLHAANLPCNGILRNLPTSYAEVTSIRSKASRSGPHYNDDANVSAATIEW